jgi:isoamylase
MGRTQRGNNNAYCQDNEVAWQDWENLDETMLRFAQRVVALRRSQPVLRRQRFFAGQVGRGVHRKDIAWFRRDGKEMEDEHWGNRHRQSLGMLLNGDLIPDRGRRGERIRGDTLLILLHAGEADTRWTLPTGWGDEWEMLLDTAVPDEPEGRRRFRGGGMVRLVGRSVVILRRVGEAPQAPAGTADEG